MTEAARPGAITFVRFGAEHAPLMYDWLRRPHVAEVWSDPPSLDEILDEYVYRPHVDPYVVHLDGRPIGFIQSYVAAGSGGGWWPDITDPGVVGTDQFIGEAELLDRGVGTTMIGAFVARLFEDPAVTMVQVDPRPTNARAIRCYEKVGFQAVAVVDTPDGPALYMTLPRARFGG
jgi:RimJ/RimL family protein N-acetyltransferase